MGMPELVVTAVLVEGRSKSEVAREYGVSRRWVITLVQRYLADGEPGLRPRSRRPRNSPLQTAKNLENEVIELRKELDRGGHEAGAATIAFHLEQRHGTSPAMSTIWRILSARGFVTPQPHKRPKSSYIRFQAEQPNERWQLDITHCALADGADVEILNILDDHSRLNVASVARRVTLGPDVVTTFAAAFTRWGTPASVLTDNGAIFTAKQRGAGRTALELTLGALGIKYTQSRPYHPQTCGKVERFHQTQKKWLRAHPKAHTLAQLQRLLDEFSTYYNNSRRHRGIDRRVPIDAFNTRPKAFPTGYHIPPHYRVRTDTIDAAGVITIRYNSHLHHIGLGKRRTGTKVTVLIDDRHIRVLDRDTGTLIRELVLDPTRDYQPRGVKCGNSPENRQ